MSSIRNLMQKHFRTLCLGSIMTVMMGCSGALLADNGNVKIGLVNFKEAIEKSKLGQQEQEMYDNMKKQIETILSEKEEEFQKISKKLKDDDFRESQKPEALQKLQEQYQQLGTELAQGQQQYYQALQQANFKILQRIADVVSKASEKVAGNKSLDLIINDDNSFYNSPRLDVTSEVIAEMDRIAAEELKDAANSAQSNNMEMPK
jgi:outer membrane protein